MPARIEKLRFGVGGVELQVLAAGPRDGEPLIFLHGFPEFSDAWREQLYHFAAAGYRVLAPDQRGCGASDKPAGVAAYRIGRLAGDVLALMDAQGLSSAHVVGHDWGGIVLWHLLTHHADRLRSAVVLNAPHLSVWQRRMLGAPTQMLKSWYVFAFQLPRLPERLMAARGNALLFRLSGLGQALDPGQRRRYRQAYAGALGTMMNWYRAAMRAPGRGARAPQAPIDTPVLILWGREDAFLDQALAYDSAALCADARLQFVDDASHWLVHEHPARINRDIAEFLAEHTAAATPARRASG